MFNSFFFEQLLNKKYDFNKLSKYLIKKQSIKLKYKYYYIPVIFANHWFLIKVDTYKRIISSYDSLKIESSGSYCMDLIKTFFTDLLLIKDWKVETAPTPQQDNYYDCGIYLCRFLKSLITKKTIILNSDDIPILRIFIGLELIKGKIIL